MRALLPVVILVLLAGCTSDDGGFQLELPERVSLECPSFPDGTPIDCSGTQWTEPQSGRPSLADGWKCSGSWSEGELATESWVNADGRIGMYWSWTPWKDDGVAFQRVAVYLGESTGGALHSTYTPEGFMAFDEAFDAQGRVDIHNTLRIVRSWVDDGDGFVVAENVEPIITAYGGETWIIAKVTHDDATYYVDLMVSDPETDEHSQWGSSMFQGTIDGRHYIIQSVGNGIKYTNRDPDQMALLPSSCGVL